MLEFSQLFQNVAEEVNGALFILWSILFNYLLIFEYCELVGQHCLADRTFTHV